MSVVTVRPPAFSPSGRSRRSPPRISPPPLRLSPFRRTSRPSSSNTAAAVTAQAIAEFREAVRLNPGDADALGSLAWLLATASSAALRDPAQAVGLAERAAGLVGRRRATALDILAVAQAANGQFAVAVETCDAALALNPEASLAAAIRQRRALYESGRPYVRP